LLRLLNVVQQTTDIDDLGPLPWSRDEPQFEKSAEAPKVGIDFEKS
jgi:hypothetical protein